MSNLLAEMPMLERLTTTDSAVPKGYKRTEVGVIPEDWKCVSSNEVISYLGGYAFSSKSARTDGVRWLKIANVGVNEVKWDVESYLPTSYSEVHHDYLLRASDVVMALTRPILSEDLKVAILNKIDTPALLNQRVARLMPKNTEDQRFIYYLVQTSDFIAAMNLAMAGSDPPNIGTKALGEILVSIPESQKEQTAIANALSDIDALISKLEKLIAKKQAIKTATMQQLLTGRTRLPQFALREDGSKKGYKHNELGEVPEDWGVVSFGVLFEPVIIKKSIKDSTMVTFVGMQDVTESAQLTHQNIISYNKVKNGFTYFERGDVLLAKITPCFENGKGCHAVDLKTEQGFGSTEFHVLRASESADPRFIYFWTTQSSFRIDLEAEMVGSAGHRRVPISAVASYKIPCPTKPEQTAIATILSDMDEEIQALEQRLTKTRQIKQGMMQVLLTGKIRLKSEGDKLHK